MRTYGTPDAWCLLRALFYGTPQLATRNTNEYGKLFWRHFGPPWHVVVDRSAIADAQFSADRQRNADTAGRYNCGRRITDIHAATILSGLPLSLCSELSEVFMWISFQVIVKQSIALLLYKTILVHL